MSGNGKNPNRRFPTFLVSSRAMICPGCAGSGSRLPRPRLRLQCPQVHLELLDRLTCFSGVVISPIHDLRGSWMISRMHHVKHKSSLATAPFVNRPREGMCVTQFLFEPLC